MLYLCEHFHQKIRQYAIVIAVATLHLLIYKDIFFLVYKVFLYCCCCAANIVNKQGYRYQKLHFLSVMSRPLSFSTDISGILGGLNLAHAWSHSWFEAWLVTRDGYRERGARGHLSFWGPTQVWPILPFAWKAWKYAPLVCSAPSTSFSFVNNPIFNLTLIAYVLLMPYGYRQSRITCTPYPQMGGGHAATGAQNLGPSSLSHPKKD